MTKQLLPSDGVPKICDRDMIYQGMEEGGLRRLNCDFTGRYANGTDEGTFTWEYSMDTENPSKVFVNKFSEWDMGPSAIDEDAVLVFMHYKGGSLDGNTYGAVIGVASNGQLQMSPHWASKPE